MRRNSTTSGAPSGSSTWRMLVGDGEAVQPVATTTLPEGATSNHANAAHAGGHHHQARPANPNPNPRTSVSGVPSFAPTPSSSVDDSVAGNAAVSDSGSRAGDRDRGGAGGGGGWGWGIGSPRHLLGFPNSARGETDRDPNAASGSASDFPEGFQSSTDRFPSGPPQFSDQHGVPIPHLAGAPFREGRTRDGQRYIISTPHQQQQPQSGYGENTPGRSAAGGQLSGAEESSGTGMGTPHRYIFSPRFGTWIDADLLDDPGLEFDSDADFEDFAFHDEPEVNEPEEMAPTPRVGAPMAKGGAPGPRPGAAPRAAAASSCRTTRPPTADFVSCVSVDDDALGDLRAAAGPHGQDGHDSCAPLPRQHTTAPGGKAGGADGIGNGDEGIPETARSIYSEYSDAPENRALMSARAHTASFSSKYATHVGAHLFGSCRSSMAAARASQRASMASHHGGGGDNHNDRLLPHRHNAGPAATGAGYGTHAPDYGTGVASAGGGGGANGEHAARQTGGEKVRETLGRSGAVSFILPEHEGLYATPRSTCRSHSRNTHLTSSSFGQGSYTGELLIPPGPDASAVTKMLYKCRTKIAPIIPRAGGALYAGVNMAQVTLGAGALGVPLAVSKTGLGLGLVVLIGTAVASAYTSRMLVIMRKECRVTTYESLAGALVHKHAGLGVALFVLGLCIGIAVVYIIAVGDIIEALLGAWGDFDKFHPDPSPQVHQTTPVSMIATTTANALHQAVTTTAGGAAGAASSSHGFDSSDGSTAHVAGVMKADVPLWARHIGTIAVWLFAMLPLSLQRDITALRYASLFALVALLALVAAVFSFAFVEGNYRPVSEWAHFGNFNLSAVYALPTVVFSYVCQISVFEVLHEMRPRRVNTFTKAAGGAMTFASVIYILIGISGAAAFGPDTKANILRNFTGPMLRESPYVAVSMIGYAFTLAFSFPVLVFPVRDAVLHLIKEGDAYSSRQWVRLLVSFIIAFVSLLTGLFFRDIVVLFSVLGGICGSGLVFVFPGVLGIQSKLWATPKSPWYHAIVPWGLAVGGTIFGLLGTGVALSGAITGDS